MSPQERIFAPTSEQRQFTRESFNRMVEDWVKEGWVENPLVAEAFKEVDRMDFIPEGFQYLAYTNEIIPLGRDSSISEPWLTAVMLNNLDLHKIDKVLEIGTGSGYSAAILAHCAEQVYTIEYNPKLTDQARERLLQLGHQNIEVYCRDGVLGLPEKAPFDAILITAGAREIPKALIEQLAGGGRMVLPVGKDPWNLRLIKAIKFHGKMREIADLGKVRFVPLFSSASGGFTEEQLVAIRKIKEEYVRSVAQENSISFDEMMDLLVASAGFLFSVDRNNILDHIPIPEELLEL